jgi:hypothetical protein
MEGAWLQCQNLEDRKEDRLKKPNARVGFKSRSGETSGHQGAKGHTGRIAVLMARRRKFSNGRRRH